MLKAWAVQWYSHNKREGEQRHLQWDNTDRFRLFPTRRECRVYIDKKYGYIRERPDLRAEPFGWRMPQAVRVTVVLAAEREA